MSVRSGAEYIAGLQDGRDVWRRGEPVKDITVHPTFASRLQVLSRLYDLQCQPAYRQMMTYPSPQTGDPVGQSFRMPRSAADLASRRAMLDAWASLTGGMLAQSPDYANMGLMALAAARNVLASGDPRFGVHALQYYEYCRERDLCVAHVPAVSEPPSANTSPPYAPAFRVTSSGSNGLRVSGMCRLAPLAPFADELLICGGASLKSGEGQHALALALPLATPGISLICQETPEEGHMDHHPLALHTGLPDCALLFEDVLAPWDRVFLSGNVELHNRLLTATGFAAQVGHQILTRQTAKTILLLGIIEQLSQVVGMSGLRHVQAKLGDLITTLEAMQSCLRRAEVDAAVGPGGVWTPNAQAIRAGRRLFAGSHPRMVELLQVLGAGSHMIAPRHADFEGSMSQALANYELDSDAQADEQQLLFRLAWDVMGGRFGMRHPLFESDIPADVERVMADDYQRYDFQPAQARLRALLDKV